MIYKLYVPDFMPSDEVTLFAKPGWDFVLDKGGKVRGDYKVIFGSGATEDVILYEKASQDGFWRRIDHVEVSTSYTIQLGTE